MLLFRGIVNVLLKSSHLESVEQSEVIIRERVKESFREGLKEDLMVLLSNELLGDDLQRFQFFKLLNELNLLRF